MQSKKFLAPLRTSGDMFSERAKSLIVRDKF